jgi:XRE family transcriptional regulator, regulator of sulfur utilization
MPRPQEKPPLNPWLAALGKAVKSVRKERGLTQEGLGDLVDRDHKFAGEVERGHRNLKYMTLVLLAEALRVTPGELLSLADRFYAGERPGSSPRDV